jgi:long-chain acyl-CoA synthetase
MKADAPPEYRPLPINFLDAVDRFANPRAQMYRAASGWLSISAREMLRRVAGLSKALAALGIKTGDRVAIFATNCPEWHISDFAIQGLGAITVPIYFNESPDRIAYILNDSGARVAITVGEAQARRIVGSREQYAALEHAIAVDAPEDLRAHILQYETFIAAAGDADVGEYRRRASAVMLDQLATIIYTSGTTGEPKGVMLSHSNLSSNAASPLEGLDVVPSDIALSLLPLAHVYERTMDYAYLFNGISIAYVAHVEKAAEAFLEVQPTIAAAVPRLYEKIYAGIIEAIRSQSGPKRKLADWALRVSQKSVLWRAYGKPVSALTRIQWQLADKLAYSKIRARLGGRMRKFSSGGAPLATELAEFFWSIDVPVYQGYGLTETSPIVSANKPGANKVGTVGRPVTDVEVRIADDGEILVKGPCVMQGYYNKPDQTREVFTADGWFSTGDIGRVDEDGYLIITDRKKELLKTAGGKFVAPAPIENLLKTSRFISSAIVVGDRRKFPAALIVPDFAAVEAEARHVGREFQDPSNMISDPWLIEFITREADRLLASLPQYEKPKRFALLEHDFTYANGELTYTMKLKRKVIEQHYEDVIARLYADVEEPRPQHLA